MTDGIVQKVCNKIIRNTDISYDAKNTAYQIREELIEEIKKNIDTVIVYGHEGIGRIYKKGYHDAIESVRQTLIGDSE